MKDTLQIKYSTKSLVSHQKRLIYIVGYEDFYFKLASMTAHTIRLSGYKDDIVILTTKDFSNPHAEVINVAKHKDVDILKTGKEKYFHFIVPERYNSEQYSLPLDYFIIKSLPGTFIDRNKYDFILYMDSDILVHSCLDEIFQHDGVISDYNARSAFDDIKGLSKYLNDEQKKKAKKMLGFSGGAFGVSRKYYDFLDEYRENYLRFFPETNHDQQSLSFTKIICNEKYNIGMMKKRKYWRHYWGYDKSEMISSYDNLDNFLKKY